MRKSWFLLISLPAAFLASLPGSLPAAEVPASHREERSLPAGNAWAPDNNWVDRYHGNLERELLATVTWFDHFFGDERREDVGRAESTVRWTNDFRWDRDRHFQYRTHARASIRLPHLARKWRLVISGESRGDPTALTPRDPGNPGLDVTSRTRRASTELIYDLLRTEHTGVDFGGGFRIRIPPDAFVRLRLQHVRQLAFATLGRYTGTLFWDARERLGQSNEIDFERRLGPRTVLRWADSAIYTQSSNDWTWGTELSLLRMLSGKSAVTVGAGATGPTRPSMVVQNYRVFARYRRNFLRPWLYYEFEPDVSRPLQEDGSRETVWGATVRLELNFIGKDVARQIPGQHLTPPQH